MPSDGASVRLGGEHTRRIACKLIAEAPDGWVVKIGAPGRTLEQSSKFWTLCSLVAKAMPVEKAGDKLDKQDWHDLFLSGWNIVKGHPPRLMLGLENERVSLVKHSRWLSKDDMSDLLDYVEAWCAGHGVHVED
jgi:hypothetical protein